MANTNIQNNSTGYTSPRGRAGMQQQLHTKWNSVNTQVNEKHCDLHVSVQGINTKSLNIHEYIRVNNLVYNMYMFVDILTTGVSLSTEITHSSGVLVTFACQSESVFWSDSDSVLSYTELVLHNVKSACSCASVVRQLGFPFKAINAWCFTD